MSRLGELLVREKMISLQQLQRAQEEAKRTGKRLGHALTQLGFVNDTDLTQFLARQYSLPSINLNEFDIDPVLLAEQEGYEGVGALLAGDLTDVEP